MQRQPEITWEPMGVVYLMMVLAVASAGGFGFHWLSKPTVYPNVGLAGYEPRRAPHTFTLSYIPPAPELSRASPVVAKADVPPEPIQAREPAKKKVGPVRHHQHRVAQRAPQRQAVQWSSNGFAPWF